MNRSLTLRAFRVGMLATVVTIAAFVAGSCGSATRPSVSPNVQLIARFDSLRRDAMARFDFRESDYALIEQFLAEGAPIQTATMIIDGRVIHDSAVASLQLSTPTGQSADSTLYVILWDGNGPDSVISIGIGDGARNAATFVDFSLGQTFLGSTEGGNPLDTLELMMSRPGAACASLLHDAPSDADLRTPTQCRTQTFSLAYKLFPELGTTDTVVVPVQTIRDVRVLF